jgi:predicted nucleic acid-binding protein
MIVVSDTSAITALLQTGQEEILATLYSDVIIPREVESELLRFHAGIPAFIRVFPVTDAKRFRKLCAEVDVGEAAAITLMLEGHGDLLLIDERRGRTIAEREGIRVVGLLGVLLEAKLKGAIPSLAGAIEQVERVADFRISHALKLRALTAAGEQSR